MKKNKTPIVFSFNDGYLVPAGVCITSLLLNANENTFYDIFILHSSTRLSEESKQTLLKLKDEFNNCNFTFIDVKGAFTGAFEIRNITIDAYYRLLIPKVIKRYDRVIYSDVDVIFLADVSESLYLVNENDKIAAVKAVRGSQKYFQSIGLEKESYFNSGYIVFDLMKIEDYTEKLNELIKRKFIYQDQDIMNIIFKDQISEVPINYCYTFYGVLKKRVEQDSAFIYHYAGPKPWDKLVAFGDVWWEYFRKSIFYDEAIYRKFNLDTFNEIEDIYFTHRVFRKTGFLKIAKFARKIISDFKYRVR